MPGKKWCEFCHINLPFNKKDIQDHEQTRNHLENKRKEIKHQQIMAKKEENAKRQESKKNALLSSANIPKFKRGSKQDQEMKQYQLDVMQEGKHAIHKLIAERTHGLYGAPVQFPNKQDLVLAENYVEKEEQGSDSEELEMWKIDICEEQGDPCFYNVVTQVKMYEPPPGYVMSAKQKEEWQYLKEICQEKINEEQNGVNISDWQEVADQDNYFKVNAIEPDPEDQLQNQEQKSKRTFTQMARNHEQEYKDQPALNQKQVWLEQLQEKVNNNQLSTNEVIESVVYNKLKQCKNLKQKNQMLKKLIKSDIEIHEALDQSLDKQKQLIEQPVQKVSFKPKKKVKKAIITDDIDIY